MLDETAFVGRRVCVVGNINRDLRTAPVPAGDNLFQDGETSTPFIRETLGGGAANSALAAAGLGADVRLVGKIGEDRTGYHLEAVLAAHNVRPFLVPSVDMLQVAGPHPLTSRAATPKGGPGAGAALRGAWGWCAQANSERG